MKKIVIIGGGAGGFELATALGDELGVDHKANITLVDKNSYHIWKPLLHEVATGVLDEQVDNIYYAAQAHQHNFSFKQGTFLNIDRDNKQVLVDDTNKQQIKIDYDILVLAIGSTSNDFGTPGVKEHCIFLDDQNAAIHLRELLLSHFTHFCILSKQNENTQADKIRIAIVGGGATGVELASELPNMMEKFGECGSYNANADLLDITLIEATDRILPALPAKTASGVTKTLESKGIHVLTNTMITKAEKDGFYPKDGDVIKADIMIWTAGVKAPDFLKDIAGLETTRSNQLVVKPTLQTSRDDNIFAIGDCASCMQNTGRPAPPTAQGANQMANICAINIEHIIDNKPLKNFKYTDKGTIISLQDTAQGVVTLLPFKAQIGVKGWIAVLIHRLLYRMHQAKLLGIFRTLNFTKASKIMHKLKSSSIFSHRDK